MGTKYFSILGLAPGPVRPRRSPLGGFRPNVPALLAALRNPATAVDARRQLDCLHMAYAVLRDPRGQESILQARRSEDNDLTRLKRLIAASLEDGLLRFSRLAGDSRRGAVRGASLTSRRNCSSRRFSSATITSPCLTRLRNRPPHREARRAWAGLAAAGALALALFLVLVRWLEV